jgi:broad specificity phosphatase PhoE
MLPIDIVIVRHGESEGNVAIKASRKGDNSLFTPEFRNRHSRDFRLGIKQAQVAGDWIKEKIGMTFDRHLVSDYIRAKETAGLLDLPHAAWSVEYQLRERDKALMDNLPPDVQARLFSLEQAQYELDPFLSIPAGGGESIPALCLRLKADVIAQLARDYSSMKLIIVCHGHVMRALQLELLNLGHDDFIRLDGSDDPKDEIQNCRIMWFTRRNPETGQVVGDRLFAWRSVWPWNPEATDTGWQKIVRSKFTNEELLDDVNRYPRHAN